VRARGASAVDCGCLLPLWGGGSLLPVARSQNARPHLLRTARSKLRPPQKRRPASAVQGLAALMRPMDTVSNHAWTHFQSRIPVSHQSPVTPCAQSLNPCHHTCRGTASRPAARRLTGDCHLWDLKTGRYRAVLAATGRSDCPRRSGVTSRGTATHTDPRPSFPPASARSGRRAR